MTQSESSGIRRLETLAEWVRRRSRAGEVVHLEEVWEGTVEEIVALQGPHAVGMIPDLQMIRGGASWFLFSDRHMTRAYAESAARAAGNNPLHMIAAAVRSDSATYPRPTPMSLFRDRPYRLSPEDVAAAVSRMEGEEEFGDIRQVQASNGDRFLFSLRHISQAQAEAMAEWYAVRQFDNP